MAGIRWRTIIAAFSVSVLGASIVCEVPQLLAKDPASNTTSAGKPSTKKKSDKRSAKTSQNAESGDSTGSGSTSGSSVGGGVVGGGISNGNNNSGSNSSNGGNSGSSRNQTASPSTNPPGIGGATAGTNQSKPRKSGSGSALNSKRAPLNSAHPLVKKVMDVQNRNQQSWLNQKGVVGASTGLDSDSNVVIRVYVTGADNPVVPTQIEGVAVVKVLTGPIRFAQGTGVNLPPTPAPIGTSTFINTQGQSAVPCQGSRGTIGCRMVDSNSTIYALSCNHVFAGNLLVISSFDQATQVSTDQTVTFFPVGTNALQPAGNDVGCKTPPNKYSNILGTLSVATPFYAFYIDPGTGNNDYTTGFYHVDANGNPTNFTDSALVATNTASLDTATPPDGYGIPTDNYNPPVLGLNVQKYGAATRLTTGSVSGLNATYNIQVDISTQNVLIKQTATQSITNGTVTYTYTAGFAGLVTVPFSQQVEVTPTGAFSAFALQGDSGALVVDQKSNPVALVQALGTSPIVFCGDFKYVLADLAKAIATATGNQVALHVDHSPSALQQSQDGKVGRASPNKP